MQYYEKRAEQKPLSTGGKIIAFIARLALAIIIPLAAFFVLYQGFLFLRGGDAPKWLITIVAVIWGVGGVALLYWIFNWLAMSRWSCLKAIPGGGQVAPAAVLPR